MQAICQISIHITLCCTLQSVICLRLQASVIYMQQTQLVNLCMATYMGIHLPMLLVEQYLLQKPHSGAFAFFNLTLRPTLGFPALPSGFFSAMLCCAALSFSCAPEGPSAVPLAC